MLLGRCALFSDWQERRAYFSKKKFISKRYEKNMEDHVVRSRGPTISKPLQSSITAAAGPRASGVRNSPAELLSSGTANRS